MRPYVKLFRPSVAVVVEVLIATFRASVEGLSIFLVTLCTCVMFYSSAIYYAEILCPSVYYAEMVYLLCVSVYTPS